MPVDWLWSDEQSSDGVVHQSVTNTDNDDATILKQGYDYQNFGEITPDPYSCYPLHEDSGATADDVAGARDGTVSGASQGVTGILGTSAYSFDGIDDYVRIGSNDAFALSSGSMFAWVNISTIESSGSTSDSQYVVSLESVCSILNNGVGEHEVNIYDGSAGNSVVVDASPSTGEWTMIGMTWDGSTLRGYLNGSFVSSTASGSPGFGLFSRESDIGINFSDARGWSGDIGPVYIYDTVLSDAQMDTMASVVTTSGTWTGTQKVVP